MFFRPYMPPHSVVDSIAFFNTSSDDEKVSLLIYLVLATSSSDIPLSAAISEIACLYDSSYKLSHLRLILKSSFISACVKSFLGS